MAEVFEMGLLASVAEARVGCRDIVEPSALDRLALAAVDRVLPRSLVALMWLNRLLPMLLVALRILWATWPLLWWPESAESSVEAIREGELRPPTVLDNVDWMLLWPGLLSIDKTLLAPAARLLTAESSVEPNLELA